MSGKSSGISGVANGISGKNGMILLMHRTIAILILVLTFGPPCLSQHDHHDHQVLTTTQQQLDRTTPVSPGNDNQLHDHSNLDSSDENYAGHQMYFFTSTNSTILFLQWTTSSWQSLLLACFLLFITTVFYEGLGVLALHITTVSLRVRSRPLSDRNTARMKAVSLHLLQTLIHVVRLILAYSLMLVFMTFNLWLCIPIVIGAATGFLAFGWIRATAIPPHDLDGDLASESAMKLEQCH